MDKYNSLLRNIANQYQVPRGKAETDIEWKTRLIYSVCGMMAYASLWDDLDNTISIIHLKGRIRKIFLNYLSMYPELSSTFPKDSNELEEEITSQFLNCGLVYHHPNRVAPSMQREELFNGILFQRGISLDSISSVSGIGFYSKVNGSADPKFLKSMFGLEQENLLTLWQNILSNAFWESSTLSGPSVRYLRMRPPFTQGYWTSEPDKTGVISILRVGLDSPRLYYLYHSNGSDLEISPLPYWMVEKGNYRAIACSCLLSHGTLPPIEFSQDGSLVHLHLNYLLPPRELEFLKLYSWPERCITLPSDFNRKLSTDVFKAIQTLLSEEGYNFKEKMT